MRSSAVKSENASHRKPTAMPLYRNSTQNYIAKEFLERVEMEPDTLLLGTLVHRHYVVEIDDGLKPAFFYKTAGGYRYEPFFDGNRARSNTLEEETGGI